MATKKKTGKKKVHRSQAVARKKGARSKKVNAAATPHPNLLDAAAEVLATTKKPMSCREIVEAVLVLSKERQLLRLLVVLKV